MLSSLQKNILSLISANPVSAPDLAKKLGQSESSIRARVSELRKIGYSISRSPYSLSLSLYTFEEAMERKNFWGRTIPLSVLVSNLKTTPEELKDFLAHNFERYNITQLDSSTLVIRKL